jgi:hypothetical protein
LDSELERGCSETLVGFRTSMRMFRNPSWIQSSNEDTPKTDQASPRQRDTDRHGQTDITQNYYGSKIHSNTTIDRKKTTTKLD